MFHPLTLVPDGADVIVGRRDIDCYAAFPADGADLLRRLQAGASVTEAGEWYRERHGAAVDMADFLDTLRELKFIRSAEEPDTAVPLGRPRWQRLGRVVFAWPVWLVYCGLCGYALFLVIRFPYLRPSYQSFFFTPSLLLMELALFVGQLPGIFFHEAMHALAGRRLGIPSRLRLGNRLYILVFETDLSGLWSLPRRSRYLPLLAGMVADLVWCALLTILAQMTDADVFPGSFFRALALSTLLRLAWQFYFYLRTDLYQVLVTALRCVDLHRTTREYFVNQVCRLLRRATPYDQERWHPRDRQVARWYVYVAGFGYLFTVGSLVWIVVPAVLRVIQTGVERLFTGAAFSAQFLDGCLTLLLNAVPLLIVAVMALRRKSH